MHAVFTVVRRLAVGHYPDAVRFPTAVRTARSREVCFVSGPCSGCLTLSGFPAIMLQDSRLLSHLRNCYLDTFLFLGTKQPAEVQLATATVPSLKVGFTLDWCCIYVLCLQSDWFCRLT